MKQSINSRPVRQNSTNGGNKRSPNQFRHGNGNNSSSASFSRSQTSDSEKQINDKLINLIAKSSGKRCIVTVSSGARYQGLLIGSDLSSSEPNQSQSPSSLSVIIQNPRYFSQPLVDEKSNVSTALPEKLIIPSKQLMDLEVQDVDVDQSISSTNAVNSITTKASETIAFKTDTDISGKLKIRERELQRWVPDDDDSTLLSLEDNSGGKWDQFKVNEEKFGVESTYDEHLYTTRINTSAPDYQERLQHADKLAKEIENQVTSDPHLLEERGVIVDDSVVDEEDKYSGVDRRGDELMAALRGVSINTTNNAANTGVVQTSSPGKYVPPRQRAAQYHNDPAIISSSATSTKPDTEKKPDSIPPKPQVANPTNESFRLNAKSEINSLREFSANFKIPHKLPQDLLPILSKDKEKQDEIVKKQYPENFESAEETKSTPLNTEVASNITKKKMDPSKPAFKLNPNAASFTPLTKQPQLSPTPAHANFNKSPPNPSPRMNQQRPYGNNNNPNSSGGSSSGSGVSKRHHITPADFFGGVAKIPTKEGQDKKVKQFKQSFNMFFTAKAKATDKAGSVEFERTYITPPTWEATLDEPFQNIFPSPSSVKQQVIIPNASAMGFMPNPMMGGMIGTPQVPGGFISAGGNGVYPGAPNAGKFGMSPHQQHHQQMAAAMAHYQQQHFQAAMMYQQQRGHPQQQKHHHHQMQQQQQQYGGVPLQPPIPMYGPGGEAFLPPTGYIPNTFVGGGSPVNGHLVMSGGINQYNNPNANKHSGRKYSQGQQNAPTGFKKGKSTE